MKYKCAICGKPLVRFSDTLYHEVGAFVFPQYCHTKSGGGLHTPVPLTETKEIK